MARRTQLSPQTVAVLSALARAHQDWRYGYDLSRETGLKSGTLYPILIRLEGAGWLEAEWEAEPTPGKPRRHLYRLSPEGHRAAQQAVASVREAPRAEPGMSAAEAS